jgi:hypothetical protein
MRVLPSYDRPVADEVNAVVRAVGHKERGSAWIAGRHVLGMKLPFFDLHVEAALAEVGPGSLDVGIRGMRIRRIVRIAAAAVDGECHGCGSDFGFRGGTVSGEAHLPMLEGTEEI